MLFIRDDISVYPNLFPSVASLPYALAQTFSYCDLASFAESLSASARFFVVSALSYTMFYLFFIRLLSRCFHCGPVYY